MPVGETVGDPLGEQPDPHVQRPSSGAGHRHRPVEPAGGGVRVVPQSSRRTAARRCAARAAPGRPASGSGRRRSRPRRRGRTGPGRRAAAPRSPARSRSSQHVERRAGRRRSVGRISMPSDSPEGQEPLVDALGLEPLGHRGQSASRWRPTQAPAASQLPACGSATTAPRPGRDVAAEQLVVAPAGTPPGSAAWSAPAAGTPPASTGRTSAARPGPARRARRRAGPGRPPGAGCARSRWCPCRRCRTVPARSAPRRRNSGQRHAAAGSARTSRQPAA